MKVELVGKIYDNHSLAIVNRHIALELAKLVDKDFELSITPIDQYNPEYKVPKDQVKTLKQLENITMEEPDIQLRHTYPPLFRWPLSNKTKVIFIQPWEYHRIPFEWQYKFETFADALIVPSKWCAERFLESGLRPEKTFVVPNGYDPEVFKSATKNSNLTRFTFVGCAQFRKGLDILLNAWSNTFQKMDNVELFIKDNPKIYGANNTLAEIIRMQYHKDVGKIIYSDEDLSPKEMAELYQQTHVLVHPFRGEGFGMHIQEAMACGAFPLVSANGAPNDFVTNDNGMFINVERKYVDFANPQVMAMKSGDSLTLMGNHGTVFEPVVTDLQQKMRYLVSSPDGQKLIQKQKNSNLTTWNMAAKQYQDIFNFVYQSKEKPVRL